ncbi:MAG: SDR family NAD(P)-dependent oxidoreductase, partial [Candidatus Binatia bacterium]
MERLHPCPHRRIRVRQKPLGRLHHVRIGVVDRAALGVRHRQTSGSAETSRAPGRATRLSLPAGRAPCTRSAMLDLGLRGKAALVVGAGRGIGRACSLGLAEAGARVVCFDADEGRGRAVAEEIRRAGAE